LSIQNLINRFSSRTLALAGLAAFLVIVALWQYLSSDSLPPKMTNKDHAMAPAERRKRDKLREIDPLADTPKYVRTLELLKPQTIRLELASVGGSQRDKVKILRKIMTVAKRPYVREVSVTLLRGKKDGLSDGDVLELSKDPDSSLNVRAAMAHEIQERHMWDGVSELIRGMRDKDPRIRKSAAKSFQKLFGVGYEFDPNGPAVEREKAVKVIEGAFPKFKKHFDASKERAEKQRQIDERLR
jgi:hypothetical protein